MSNAADAATSTMRWICEDQGAMMNRWDSVAKRVVGAVVLAIAAMGAQSQTMTAQDALVLRARHVCVACHGDAGRSDNKAVPSLAGQTREYLVAQLKDFRAQIRVEAGPRGYMWGISALLDDQTIDGLAEYYAAQTPPPGRSGDAHAERWTHALRERGS
jgi:cytochrome c553